MADGRPVDQGRIMSTKKFQTLATKNIDRLLDGRELVQLTEYGEADPLNDVRYELTTWEAVRNIAGRCKSKKEFLECMNSSGLSGPILDAINNA